VRTQTKTSLKGTGGLDCRGQSRLTQLWVAAQKPVQEGMPWSSFGLIGFLSFFSNISLFLKYLSSHILTLALRRK
jgi:hypothetical protein